MRDDREQGYASVSAERYQGQACRKRSCSKAPYDQASQITAAMTYVGRGISGCQPAAQSGASASSFHAPPASCGHGFGVMLARRAIAVRVMDCRPKRGRGSQLRVGREVVLGDRPVKIRQSDAAAAWHARSNGSLLLAVPQPSPAEPPLPKRMAGALAVNNKARMHFSHVFVMTKAHRSVGYRNLFQGQHQMVWRNP